MSTTVGNIVRGAMRKSGILDAGEALPQDQGNDVLDIFRQMVDSWSNESLLIPIVGVISKQLIQGIGNYTIGIYPDVAVPASHIETARPVQIISSYIVDGAGTSFPIDMMTISEYDRIGVKSTSARPSKMYLRSGWPLNTLIFNTIPYDTDTLKMSVIQPFSELLPLISLTEVINLPPGHERALLYNLALEIGPEWGIQPSVLIATIARESKTGIKRANSRTIKLTVDPAIPSGRRGYDINEGP